MKSLMCRTVFVAVFVAALLAGGCGGGKARVKGRIVENDQPLALGGVQAAVEFTPIGPDDQPEAGKSFTAVVNGEGTFEVLASGGELPTGMYQIMFQTYGQPAAKTKKLAAPIRREIKSGNNDLTIDLAKPQG